MKFVMLTYTHMDRAAEWDAMSESEQKAIVDEHLAWFEENSARVTGGFELAYPPLVAEMTGRGGGVSVVDGPFAETKEVLGGVIEFEADSMAEAKAMAAAWPNLEREGNRVVVAVVAPLRQIA